MEMEDFSLMMMENDSLISPHASSSSSPTTQHRHPHQSSEETHNMSLTNEQVPPHHLLPRSEAAETGGGGKKRSGKCNLRKSLAWDTAFFDNPGVLDAEELCSMIQGAAADNKGKRQQQQQQLLPGIQEDICRSTDSISTLASDNFTLESLQVDLFDDIRASIQISTSLSTNPKPTPVKKLELTSRNRIATGAATTKQPCGIQGSEKLIKRGVTCPQVKQPAVKNVTSTSSICQPPKVSSKAGTVTTVTNKRASSDATRFKAETHDAKFGCKGNQLPKSTGQDLPQRTVPKPALSSKSVGATKKEAARSSSSSTSNSTLSNKKEKSPVISARRKIESRPVIKASSCSIPKASSKVPVRKKPSDNSSLSTSLASKISSSISPASSISEWSSASSSTSTVNQRSKSRASIDTSSTCRSLDSDTLPNFCSDVHFNAHIQDGIVNQVTGLPSQDVKTSMQTGLLSRSALMKPSGLRMPSPKIGFFDGAKSAVRTPSGGAQSKPQSRLPIGLPRIGAGIGSPVGSSMKARDGKLPSGIKTSAILDSLQSASPKPFQESLRASKKTPLATRGMKSPAKSSEVQEDTLSASAILDSLQSASPKPFQESLRTSKKTPLATRGMKSPAKSSEVQEDTLSTSAILDSLQSASPKPFQESLRASKKTPLATRGMKNPVSSEVQDDTRSISCSGQVGSSNNAIGKLLPGMIVASTNGNLGCDKSASPKPVQEALSASSGISPEVHNEKGGISCLKAEESVGIGKPDAADAEHTTVKPREAENNEIQVDLKGSASLFKLEKAEVEEIKVAYSKVDTSEPNNANHIEYLKPSDEMGEDAVNGNYQCNDALFGTTNVNQIVPLRNLVDGFSRDIKAVVTQVEMQKEFTEDLNSESEVCNILDCDARAESSLKKRLPNQNEVVHVNDLLMSATRTPLAAEDSLCNIEAIVLKNETHIDVKGSDLLEQGNPEVEEIKVSPTKVDISDSSKDNCLEYLEQSLETGEDEVCGDYNCSDTLRGTKDVKQIVPPTNDVLSRDIKAVDTQVEMQIQLIDSLSSPSSEKHHLNESEVVPVSSLLSSAIRIPLAAKDSVCNIEAIDFPEVSQVAEKTNILHYSENVQTPEQTVKYRELSNSSSEKCPLNSVNSD